MNRSIASLPWPRTARVRCLMQPLSVTLAEMALMPIEAPAAKDPQAEDFSHCGWFDSSRKLADGLVVTEYVDELPEDLIVEGLLWPGGQGWSVVSGLAERCNPVSPVRFIRSSCSSSAGCRR